MKITNQLKLATAVAAGIALVGCGSSSSSSDDDKKSASVDCSSGRTIDIAAKVTANLTSVSDELSSALSTAKSCDTIILPEGSHAISTSLNFNGNGSLGQDTMVTNLTIKGAGMAKATSEATTASGKTALDFTGTAGDGFFITNTKDVILSDFGVFEAANNAIKLKDTDGIIIRDIATVWETDYQASNGAYGLYPVETSNVLIENSYVQGSADAGVYVGQSDNIVVRNNIAYKNVAGIEIENSTNADVYGNTAEGNTGGVLVFDLPIGNGKYGSGVRVFDNIIKENNAPNFANASSNPGGVHIVPPGTGVIVLSTSDVEIYNNTITDHQTTSIAVTSYMMPDATVASLPNQDVGNTVLSYDDIHPYSSVYIDGWNPLLHGINIHNNTISVADGVNAPEGALIQEIIDGTQAAQTNFGGLNNGNAQLPHILYDGVGELLANTPYDASVDLNTSVFQTIINGINQVASAVFLNIIAPQDQNATLVQIQNVQDFAAYKNVGSDRVCQSNNGVDGQTIFAASVFQTTPSAENVNPATGEPFSKLEMMNTAIGGGDFATAQTLAASILSDDTMTCDGFDAYVGTAAVVTVNGETFGCKTDDITSTFCK